MSDNFDTLWNMRLKPETDNNRMQSETAYKMLLGEHTEAEIITEYRAYKRQYLDSGKPEHYAKNLVKWLSNPSDRDCFLHRVQGRSMGKDKDKVYKDSAFIVSKGLVVDNCSLGSILLGFYNPAKSDEWHAICTGEDHGYPDWQPIPIKTASRYVSAGLIKQEDITGVEWLDRRGSNFAANGKSSYTIAALKGGE